MKALPCEVSTYAKSRKDIGVSDPTSAPNHPHPGPGLWPVAALSPSPSPCSDPFRQGIAFLPKIQSHVWVRGGCESGRCDRCQKKIRIYHSLVGLHCVWCHLEVSLGAHQPLPRISSLNCPLHWSPRLHLPHSHSCPCS